MPEKGSGRFTHAEWKRPTEAMRTRKGRRFTLSPELGATIDALPEGQRSAHVEAAMRMWLGMPQLEDAPPRPKY